MNLFRNNKLIGEHKLYFAKKNEILTVRSIVSFKITKLGVDLYKYFAESEESPTKMVNFMNFPQQLNKIKKINM